MAATRRNAPPSEVDSTDNDYDAGAAPNCAEAVKKIGKLQAQREEGRERIASYYEEKLAMIKARSEQDHQSLCEKLTGLKSEKLQALIRAIEERMACEDAILQQIITLRKDADHVAMLIDAIYQARMEYAKSTEA
ncbi:hypothetical protein DL766_006744 [Monosporascus sp. MC13-8B]|uniref:Uncharacterized protein n=1 Tax=Monosporascus cannonballus TaxID=155416 RepID=A0ABY0H0G8_9PEZI|nr:hypothetical protein DL762_006978 [Monosporascus cannonballus]RYO84883.1 hypothetical protein DL763_007316 [Monosporascus cannonballus]RYP26359.1 hypothetical protein DL766_006744 [Monosporascus sp. MC13-8B]